MSKLVENLKKLDEKMQVELLMDYLKESQEDGLWIQAHAIEARLAELANDSPEAVAAADQDAREEYAAEEDRRDNQYKASFVARNCD